MVTFMIIFSNVLYFKIIEYLKVPVLYSRVNIVLHKIDKILIQHHFNRSSEKNFKHASTKGISFWRSLAKHEFKRNKDQTWLKKELPDYRKYREVKNEDDISTYGHLKKSGLNALDLYKKNYNHRYSKRKGLSRMECYFEKKVFDNLDYIEGLADNMKNNKKSYKKKIFKKYVIRFILLALLPFLGFIYPILFYGEKNALIPWCGARNHGQSDVKSCGIKYYNPDLFGGLCCLNMIYSFISVMAVVSVVVYTFIKLVKYERLKVGKGKMNRKEYINFCKEIL
ncbi:hypothetical protein PVBG_06042 [Plasmodium vivax Brazil I]|uniref:Variable surface protein Vir35 n=1 Tax=Plasmodium vivax (strain Brazil I) TaxID=1033975 RepID=A0A0J9SK51_PLAV1|nr:hypothetical protein PVBG_06042 [Plasmodium vivax Brazil I]